MRGFAAMVCGEGVQESSLLSSAQMAELVRKSVIGSDSLIKTPFGSRALTYADYTASGRFVGFVEDFLRREVYPMYANTHTEMSATGRQTNHFREEARALVASQMHADPATYAVLFAGSGMTGALDKLIAMLSIRIPPELDQRYGLSKLIPPDERPVVFVSHMEHHSNELSWRESIAEVIVVPELMPSGKMDLAFLKKNLEHFKARRRIVSFSAGSNVTGIVQDVGAIARVAKAAGALVVVDYAAAGPYVPMVMDPAPGVWIDAIVASVHKFVGGPGGAGLLVVRRSLCNTKVAPSQPGGGTIVFVTPTSQDYSPVLEQREDGGTPAIIQSIRVGLAFQIRKLVTVEHAASVQLRYVKSALARLGKHKNIYLIGGNRRSYWERARLPIVSFNILTPDENGPDEPSRIGPSVLRGGRKQLSPHFVAALLNDMFGIQGRSGCSCTGPYATRLKGWDEATTERCRQIVLRHSMEFAKPGWCRVNFCYSMDQEEVDYVIDAIEMIAEHGWKLLPLYATGWASGTYVHRSWNSNDELSWISVLSAQLRQGRLDFSEKPKSKPRSRAAHLAEAAEIFRKAKQLAASFADEVLAPGGNFIEGDGGVLELGKPNYDADAADWVASLFFMPRDAFIMLGLGRASGTPLQK